ncbi:MAG: RNA polymerase sigma factor [Planctomycetota bacterium]
MKITTQTTDSADGTVVDGWFETERDRLWGFLRSRVSCDSDADDLFQKCYLRARHGRLQDPSGVNAWIFTIAQNLVRDDFRRKKSQRIAFFELSDRQKASVPDPSTSMEQAEQSVKRQVALRECLQNLSVDERSVVDRRSEGQSHHEIATAEGWPSANRSEKTLHRAKTKLSLCLASKDIFR